MKKQRYIVEIEMPDGDFISAGLIKDLIQTDCNVEDESRKKVTVQETSIPSNLDEAGQFVLVGGEPTGWFRANDGSEYATGLDLKEPIKLPVDFYVRKK